jgi:hypothetical protein
VSALADVVCGDAVVDDGVLELAGVLELGFGALLELLEPHALIARTAMAALAAAIALPANLSIKRLLLLG